MNAQEKISIALQSSVFNQNFADDLAKELYDLVAHELAEEIRNRINGEPEGESWLREAADAIDPKVEK